MRIPSVKVLAQVTSWPKELRKLLECTSGKQLDEWMDIRQPFGKKSTFDGFPATRSWLSQCYHRPSHHELKMSMADELCGTYGVELIKRGHNVKSPPIEYCNAGDPYVATLLWVNGNYRVGGWGDIVERGQYD